MESKGRGSELKQANREEKDKVLCVGLCIFSDPSVFQVVKDIMNSISNVRNDRSKKEQAKKWSKMPAEMKTKVIAKWEGKAKIS